MANPGMKWWLRAGPSDDPSLGAKLLGCIVIGVIPDECSSSDVTELFKGVPLPVQNTHPQQRCATWAVNATLALREKGWAKAFDVNTLRD